MATFFPLFSTLLLLFLSTSPAIAGKCNKEDKKALISIKSHFNNAYHFASWTNTSACCDWYGVECSPNSDRVTGLYVIQDSLAGTIPSAIGDLPFLTSLRFHKLPNLTGSIPSSITKLHNLFLLMLSWNSLSGPIPSFLSSLTSLTDLDLSFNQFSGEIPPSLSSLPILSALHLDRNNLSGSIPSSFSSFKSSPDLYLSHNNLSGDASFLFFASSSVTIIDLNRNKLSFNLSSVTSFPVNITYLDLNHNMIFGSIPNSINELTGPITMFNVSYNRLCGEIPQGAVTSKFDEFSYFHNKCLCGPPLPACKS
ncbi:polygalacturonase inhibitor-like [Dioscorea cayenensis subsp. rotundata]|uniref:Polygalacturonase inhibitor-like n=1 Tax=Dioscorea cayennensis subsp. rotundata TaxID=55577 RepID=A0AB40C912_DIOCR|nr:polygalacturonase inhibitor-like [Dioscorea cayenensis subsp. rotundata]